MSRQNLYLTIFRHKKKTYSIAKLLYHTTLPHVNIFLSRRHENANEDQVYPCGNVFQMIWWLQCQKLTIPRKLAYKWECELLTRPFMSMKWWLSPRKCEWRAGMWNSQSDVTFRSHFWHPHHLLTTVSKTHHSTEACFQVEMWVIDIISNIKYNHIDCHLYGNCFI